MLIILVVTIIVVGRPITQATDPVAAYHAIKDEWTQDLEIRIIVLKYKGESHDTC